MTSRTPKKAKKDSFSKKIKKSIDPRGQMKYWYGYYYDHSKIDERLILAESFHGKTIGDSPLACVKEIQRLWPGKYKICYATNNMSEHRKVISELGLNVTLIDITTKEYTKVLATAGTIITNASLPIYFIRKEGQTYLQTWHGTPLKTLGKEMREGIESMYNVQHNFIQASHMLFPNEFTKDVIMCDYNLERLYTGKVIMCGYPRNKAFLTGDAKSVRKRYGTEDKTVYAYMPTWRGKSNHDIEGSGYFEEVKEIFGKLDAAMRDDQLMYVNFHPIIGEKFSFKGYEHILPFPKDIDSYEFLNSTDALVTDYSSVFFDYSLTRKPIVLFMYDYEKYMKDRGMYFDIRELPFRKIYDTDEFCRCVAEDVCLEDSYAGTDYEKKFLSYDAPDNTEKLLRCILEGDEDCLEIIDYSDNRDRKIEVIAPEIPATEGQMRALAKAAEQGDKVVLMYKNWFERGFGQLLYDDFNDAFDYVITTNTPPRSHFTQLKKKLGSRSAAKKIHSNDVKRCFGSLDVDPKFVKEYGACESGCRADISKAVLVETSLKECGDAAIRFDFTLDEGHEPEKAVLLDDAYVITEERPLTDEEKRGSFVEFDFHDAIEKYHIYNTEYGTPALLCRDKEGGAVLVCFTDSKKAGSIKSWGYNEKRGRTYEPLTAQFELPKAYDSADLKYLMNSHEEDVRDSIRSLDMTPETKELAILPLLFPYKKKEIISVYVRVADRIIDNYTTAGVLKKYRFSNDSFSITAFFHGWKAEEFAGAVLRLDSDTEQAIIAADWNARDVSGGCLATMRIDSVANAGFMPLRWHCNFIVKAGGKEHYIRIRNISRITRYSLKMRNVQAVLPNGYILYPYLGLQSVFKLCYREKSEFDTAFVRLKEAIAMGIYVLGKSAMRRKKRYLIYEKFSRTAQDNSYYFFKYCMEQMPESERKRFWYVIDKKSQDYQYVKEFEPKVIQFMSIKHMLYAMTAKLLISTDSTPHLYAWQTKPSFVYSRIRKKDVLFLQHGVTAMKRVDHLFGMNGSSPMRYFVATSETEQRIVVNEFGYKQEDVPITGFTRWDVLEDKSDPDDRFILLMPTWRVWLEDVTDDTFINSDYYTSYYELLTGERLKKLLDDGGVRLVMYLHPKFARYVETFRARMPENIELIAFGEQPLNELMMRAGMLITDYSSVCWDMLFMDKPVVFFQFDTDKYLKAHGSYIDLKHDLPGPRVTDASAVMDNVEYYVNNGFRIQDDYEAMLDKYFAFRDKNNCERTYRFLKQKER